MTRATRLTVRGRRRLLAGSEFPADPRRVVSAYHRIDRLFHRDAGDPHSVGHRDLDLLERLEAACEVQRHTGKRGQQGELPEALAPGSGLALLDDAPAEATWGVETLRATGEAFPVPEDPVREVVQAREVRRG